MVYCKFYLNNSNYSLEVVSCAGKTDLTSKIINSSLPKSLIASMPISKNIHEEGLLIKTSLIKKTLDDELIKQIAKSSRTPDERYADLQAQIATLDFANKKFPASVTRVA